MISYLVMTVGGVPSALYTNRKKLLLCVDLTMGGPAVSCLVPINNHSYQLSDSRIEWWAAYQINRFGTKVDRNRPRKRLNSKLTDSACKSVPRQLTGLLRVRHKDRTRVTSGCSCCMRHDDQKRIIQGEAIQLGGGGNKDSLRVLIHGPRVCLEGMRRKDVLDGCGL